MNEPKPQEGAASGANMRPLIFAVVLIPLVAVILFVMLSNNDGGGTDPNAITTASGLKYVDVQVGTGKEAQPGDEVEVHYTGWLRNGTKFDSSRDRGKPFSFPLGAGKVIKGWDEGVAGMKEGGKRKLFIPFELAYGADGRPPSIPPRAALTFDVELISVK